ncbi:alpha/beta hydrolase [Cohnella phaseoli]|uniref:Serine aminopeptidase S33 family n=1 Tax=Cohnella phaseoli TaxID=456490 RepID=A0A3D9JPG1_9BACL|nr:serine aminopeptidase S33 family [Cohnella phaseoli]
MATCDLVSLSPSTKSRPNPILFIHGAFHGSWAWEEYFLPYFANQGYEVRALNWRGHGHNAGRERLRQYRISHYVEDVLQAAYTLNKPPILVGHSMGGFVIQKYLENHSAPAGVLLASAPPGGTRKNTVKTAVRNPGKMMKSLITGRVNLYITKPERFRHSFHQTCPKNRSGGTSAPCKMSHYRPLWTWHDSRFRRRR